MHPLRLAASKEVIANAMAYEFCVIGHITRDRIAISGKPVRVQPGGTVYYSGLTAARLGLQTAAITRMREADRSLLLNGMRTAGISVRAFESPCTTEYVNRFSSDKVDERTQEVHAVAAPFQPEDICVDADVYVFGPLTQSEFSLDCVEQAASSGRLIAMDVQGLIRRVHGRRVVHVKSGEALKMLRRVNILKAGCDEAMLLTGENSIESAAHALYEAGPHEVLVTSGGAGSHVLADGEFTAIPAYAPPQVVDTTGCGDTYLAAYVARRLSDDSPGDSAHFASLVAGAKTAYHGAFRGNIESVCNRYIQQGARSRVI